MMTEIIRTKDYYAPYHLYPAFDKGFQDWRKHLLNAVSGENTDICICPYSRNTIDGQAWDRGAEYASHLLDILLSFENKVCDLHKWLYSEQLLTSEEEIVKAISYLQGHLQYMSNWMKQQQMS
jgi:hypothetical protein